jgi:nucleoside phosphorylase
VSELTALEAGGDAQSAATAAQQAWARPQLGGKHPVPAMAGIAVNAAAVLNALIFVRVL